MPSPVPPYQPSVFSTLAASALGQGLWQLLTGEEARLRMQTASDLGRPAVEGIEELLLKTFGAQLLDDRVKQMVGHMARQVMEHDGYVVDAQNIKLTNGAPFSRATRYKRRDSVTFHAWHLTTDQRALVLTADKSGHRLPPAPSGSWRYWKSFEGKLRACIGLGLPDVNGAQQAIAAEGYYRHRLERLLRAPTAAA